MSPTSIPDGRPSPAIRRLGLAVLGAVFLVLIVGGFLLLHGASPKVALELVRYSRLPTGRRVLVELVFTNGSDQPVNYLMYPQSGRSIEVPFVTQNWTRGGWSRPQWTLDSGMNSAPVGTLHPGQSVDLSASMGWDDPRRRIGILNLTVPKPPANAWIAWIRDLQAWWRAWIPDPNLPVGPVPLPPQKPVWCRTILEAPPELMVRP